MRKNRRSLREGLSSELKFKISSYRFPMCEIDEDSYEDGEGDFVEDINLNLTGLYNSIQEIINDAFYELEFDNIGSAHRDIKNWGFMTENGSSEIFTDVTLFYDDMESTYYVPDEDSDEIEMWKNGEIKGYVAHIYIPIEVTVEPRSITEEEAKALGLEVF